MPIANPARTNAANLKLLSPVFVSYKHRLYPPPNFAPRCVGALLMPVERLAPIRPVLPLVRQKLLLQKPINQTSTVSAKYLHQDTFFDPKFMGFLEVLTEKLEREAIGWTKREQKKTQK